MRETLRLTRSGLVRRDRHGGRAAVFASGKRSNPCRRLGPDERALPLVESDETERPGKLGMVLL
jgi:hypothetical protein